MNPAAIQYHSYLLRLWKISAGDAPIWRASLESPITGQRQGFVCLRDLIAYLTEQCDDELPAPATPPMDVDSLAAGAVHR
jgi:hypothetical protein